MKLMRIFLGLLFIVFVSQLSSQSSRVSSFSVSGIGGNSTLVKWTMNAGSTCLDLSVQRSTDELSFETVYRYPGVCGSEDIDVDYTWVDLNPISFVKNHYRLKLEEAEFTLVQFIDFSSELRANQVFAFPNPTSSAVTLTFENPDNLDYKLSVFDKLGLLVMERSRNNGESVTLDISSLKTGLYVFEIRFNNDVIYSTTVSKS